MIPIIAAIAELLFFSTIAAITAMVAIIWKPGFREREKLHISAFCSLGSTWSLRSLWSLRSPESVFYIIAMIAGITELFFFHSDHNDHMETRLYRWRFFSLLLILEKWMIYRFRPSLKVWTKFRQDLHPSYIVCLFFFLIQSIQAQTKGTQKLFMQENSEDCQAQPKQNSAFIKPNWRRNTQSKAF